MSKFSDQHFYRATAAAFCRGRCELPSETPVEEALAAGEAAGLRLHKFKRNASLPRVRQVLGILRGLSPAHLLDIGSGRGTFLWPMLEVFSALSVTAVERDEQRTADLAAVGRGGLSRLTAVRSDATDLFFDDDAFDVATALEVLEHMPAPEQAAAELVRVTRRFVVVSVPSRPDDNPEHIQLFDAERLSAMFRAVGARNVNVHYVPQHIIAVVSLRQEAVR